MRERAAFAQIWRKWNWSSRPATPRQALSQQTRLENFDGLRLSELKTKLRRGTPSAEGTAIMQSGLKLAPALAILFSSWAQACEPLSTPGKS